MWRTLYRQKSSWCSRIVVGVTICVLLTSMAASNRSIDRSYRNQVLAAARPVSYSPVEERQTELERLAREDPIRLLKLSQKSYQNSVRDYVCTFIKQERVDGHLKEQEKMRVCFKEAPFSALMSWYEPKGLVDRILYVEKDNNTTMLVRPAGLPGLLVRTVRRDVHDPRIKKVSLRGPHQFGFGRSLQDMIGVYEQAAQNGDLVTEYRGNQKVGGRDCLVLVRDLPMAKGYPVARLVVYLDKDYLLPTRVESYDAAGNRMGLYMFLDVRFNLGLTDELFTPEANDLDG